MSGDRQALLSALAGFDCGAASPQELGTTKRRMEALRDAGDVILHTVFNHKAGRETTFYQLTEQGKEVVDDRR